MAGFANSACSNVYCDFVAACATLEVGDWSLDDLDTAMRKAWAETRLGSCLFVFGYKYCVIQISFLYSSGVNKHSNRLIEITHPLRAIFRSLCGQHAFAVALILGHVSRMGHILPS
jgi:hypothetical protein